MKHLFILSGQSNMQGMNPDLSFTPTVEAAFADDTVVVVKEAQGGQPILRWYKQWKSPYGEERDDIGGIYDTLMDKVRPAVAAHEFDTVTFAWMQGERDANEGFADVYAESLRGVYDQLSEDLGRDDINYVIGRLSTFDMTNERYQHWTRVRDIQVEVAEAHPRGDWVDTDGLNGESNDLHCTKEGYVVLGERFAQKSIELIRSNQR